jgi:hypothetical protein
MPMRGGGPNSEKLRQPTFRRGIGIALLTAIAALLALNLSFAQPPSDSLASKYPPAKTEEPKPSKPSEPDPTANCPWLDAIFDDQAMPSDAENHDEYTAFNYFVGLARDFSSDILAKHADQRLTWRVLFDRDRAKYRGKIVHVEGVLKLLTWIGSNKSLESSGVKDLYEAWIFDEQTNNPTCVVISDLLPGQKTGDKITGLRASCDGYFFKRYKYRAVNDTRLAPLVIGHTLSVNQIQAPPDVGAEAFGRLFVPTVFILAFGMIALAFVIHHWFKMSDQKIHRKLLSARFGEEFVPPVDGPVSYGVRESPDEPMSYHDDIR